MSDAPKRRIGKIRATREGLMYNGEACHLLFAEFTPLEVTWDYNGVATLLGLCDKFEEMEVGMEAPFYEVQFTRDERSTSLEIIKS